MPRTVKLRSTGYASPLSGSESPTLSLRSVAIFRPMTQPSLFSWNALSLIRGYLELVKNCENDVGIDAELGEGEDLSSDTCRRTRQTTRRQERRQGPRLPSTREIGTKPANPLELSVMTRLEIRVELLASSKVAKNDTNAIVKKRQMAIDATVRIDRTGLRRALRRI